MMETEAASGNLTPPRDAGEDKIVVECVDVYLLAPEEERAVELKDFTIMKPKNNKMHRLVRYYPQCEISYRAVPPPAPEERVVTSPNGTHTTTTITTTHRHNGGFSNPSRNAEVFRLKRRLLKEYDATAEQHSDWQLLLAAGRTRTTASGSTSGTNSKRGAHGSGAQSSSSSTKAWLSSTYRRPSSPLSWSTPKTASNAGVPAVSRYPLYKRVPLGDEDTAPLSSELEPRLSWKARLAYITSLWPDVAPMDDDREIMDYYGLEVQIISEKEREDELAEAQARLEGSGSETNSDKKTGTNAPKNEQDKETTEAKKDAEEKQTLGEEDEEDGSESPVMTVETRSVAKMNDPEHKISPVASKQDDWVQCDKCQKWRRLPNHVNVSELPATWYCKMNRWDKRFNKCSTPEEKVVVPMKGAELIEYRERKFALGFLNRLKRMEKAVHHYKFADAREDDGETRAVVQCVECFKKRPLISGMDPRKVAQPFVCWMNNWDELHASCSAPQGAIPSRHLEVGGTDGSEAIASAGGVGSSTATSSSAGSHAPTKPGASGAGASSSNATSKKKTGGKVAAGHGGSGGVIKPAKRRPSENAASSGGNGHASGSSQSGSGSKRQKRR